MSCVGGVCRFRHWLAEAESLQSGLSGFVSGGRTCANACVLFTARRVPATWQLFRNNGLVWYSFPVYFSTVYYLNSGRRFSLNSAPRCSVIFL